LTTEGGTVSGYEVDWPLVWQVVIGSGLVGGAVSAAVSGWFNHKTSLKLADIETKRGEDLAKLRAELTQKQARTANAQQVIGTVNKTVVEMHESAQENVATFQHKFERAGRERAVEIYTDQIKGLASRLDPVTPHLPPDLQGKAAEIRKRLPEIIESVGKRSEEEANRSQAVQDALQQIQESADSWQKAVAASNQ